MFWLGQAEVKFENGVFSVELSTLGWDSLPKVIELRNYTTGNRAKFVQAHADMDASGEDTYGWNYQPTLEALRQFPFLSGKRLLIIND